MKGHLTVGELLAGWLMLSAVRECHIYTEELVMEYKSVKSEKERIALFYGEDEDVSENSYTDRASIKASDITFSYGDEPVLKNISADLENGKSLSIEGENGSGKSTFISILSGLYPPDSGMIEGSHGTPSDIVELYTILLQEMKI